jgi:hypothetical protein
VSTVMNGLKRFAREMLLTACAATILLSVYHMYLYWKGRPDAAAAAEKASLDLATRPAMLAGKQLAVRGAENGRHGWSIIVVTSPACRFCVNSVPFHRRLIEAAHQSGVRVLFAVPTAPGTDSFLSASGFGGATIVNWHDLSRRFQATPSVVLLNPDHVIRRIWVGELGKDEETELLTAFRNPSSVTLPRRKLASGEPMLTDAELRALSKRNGVTVVSVSEREEFRQEHPPGAINIPLPELNQRAQRDLRKERLNVIDCSAIDDMVCSNMVAHLQKVGFHVAAADLSRSE